MKPHGTPVASFILSELHTRLNQDGPVAFLAVNGRGILAPGVQIPNEWWDRKRLVYHMEVDKPQVTAEGVLAIEFRCRCAPEHTEEMKDLVHAKVRELLEREIVPPLLIQLGMLSWRERDVKPLPPVTEPFGTPVDWGPPPVPMEGVEDLVLGEVGAHGMLASEQRVARRPRVRVIDT
jgi:hypothetical protein